MSERLILLLLIDILFASLVLIRLKKLSQLEFKITKKFYNDTYLVDQNACSSPHLILWLGKQDKN